MRVGLQRRRLRSRASEPGVIVARHAPRTRPTTGRRAPSSSNGAGRAGGDAHGRAVDASTGAPSAASIRSVWSRLGRGLGDLGGAARPASPARTSAVFTCALATGERCADPCRLAAAHGERRAASPSSRPSTCAPIARSGSTIRRHRAAARRLASPVSTERNGRPASRPASSAHRGARVAAVEHVARARRDRRRRARRR